MLNDESYQLADWLSHIQKIHKREIEFGLERILPVATRLQVTHFPCPVITVSGSNGKGTTVGLLNEIYLRAGYRVGMYTSPHLIDFNERIQINSLAISDSDLCAAFRQIEIAREDIPLTFFEFTTLAALYHFKQQKLEVLLLEVGMGGRLDAVNCVEPDAAVITSISLEHQQWLGTTREAIAREKCGIMRPGIPFICGDLTPPEVIKQRVRELLSRAYFINQDYFYTEGAPWDWWTDKLRLTALPSPPIPRQNAATVLMTATCLQNRLPVAQEVLIAACASVRVPGRLQFYAEPHTTIVDVAHNPASSAYVAEQLPIQYPCQGKRWCLFSMLQDKDWQNTILPWVNLIDCWVIVPIENERAAPLMDLFATVEHLSAKPVIAKSEIHSAYQWLCGVVAPEDHIIVFGSFYLVGEVMKYCQSVDSL